MLGGSLLVETKEGEYGKRGCGKMPLFGCELDKEGNSTVLDEKRDDRRREMAVSASHRIEKTDDGGWRRFVGEGEEKEIREGVPIRQRGDEVFEKWPESVCDDVCVEIAENTEDVIFDGRGGGGEMGNEEMEGLLCHSSGRNVVSESNGATISENLHNTLLLIERERGEARMKRDVIPAINERNVPRRIVKGER